MAGPCSTTVRFEDADVFDVDAVKSLAWESRLARYRLLFLEAEDNARSGGEAAARAEKRMTVLAIDLMMLLGILERVEGSPGKAKLADWIPPAFVRALKEQLTESEDVHAAVGSALMLVVLRAAAKAGRARASRST